MPEARIVWARRWDRLWSLWLLFVFVVLPMAAWFQHVQATATAGRWVWMVLDDLIFPLGVLHGIAIWLGLASQRHPHFRHPDFGQA